MKDEHKSGEESQNMKVYSSETTVEGQAIFSGNNLVFYSQIYNCMFNIHISKHCPPAGWIDTIETYLKTDT